jgi:hypothetical protein
MDHGAVTPRFAGFGRRMRLFCLLARDFFRTPFYDALLLAGLLGLGLFLPDALPAATRTAGGYSTGEDAINLIAAFYGRAVFLGVAVFLLLGFSLPGRCKRFSLSEAVSPCGGLRKTLRTQRFLLFCLSLLWQFFTVILALWLAFTCGAAHPLFLKNVLLASILYGLLPSLTGALLGAAWQSLGNKTGFFLFFLWTVFFSSRLSTDVWLLAGTLLEKAATLQAGAAVQRVLGLWYRLPPLYNSVVDASVGIPIEPLRWVLYLTWAALAIGALLLRSRRWISAAICLCLCLLSGFCFLRGGSMQTEALLPTAELAARSDLSYYTENPDRQTRPSTDFTITDYDMTLRFGTALSAEVSMSVSGGSDPAYAFTLSHHYRVSGIWDASGSALPFTQEGDTVTVQAENADVIRMVYRGAADCFLSNAQAIWLPGYFCWYPVEGKYPVWSGCGYAINADQPTRRFSVRVYTACPCFSNLPESEDEIFSGSAATLSLVGGLYEQAEANGVRQIYPWCAAPTDVADRLAEAVERENRTSETTLPVPAIKTVIYVPTFDLPVPFGGQSAVFLGDTLLLGGYQYGLNIPTILDCYRKEAASCWN